MERKSRELQVAREAEDGEDERGGDQRGLINDHREQRSPLHKYVLEAELPAAWTELRFSRPGYRLQAVLLVVDEKYNHLVLKMTSRLQK